MQLIRFAACSALAFGLLKQATHAQQPVPAAPAAPTMILLSSPDFKDGGSLPVQFSCAASTPPPSGPRNISLGVSPTLTWSNVPDGAKSFILILHDPDSRTARAATDITHWIVFNIPGEARQLAGHVPPDGPLSGGGLQGRNMMGRLAYQGPCANSGPPHHYVFELLALDQMLDLPQGASREEIEKAAQGHILRGAVNIALFARPATK